MVWQRSRDVLPEMVDVPDGPRAPRREFLELSVGRSTLADAELLAKAKGVECLDTSMRAIMESKRAKVKEEMAAAEARGDDPDGVTGASLAKGRSKREQNPQVRLRCDVPYGAFSDRPRVEGAPLYWLMIFDSARHALRHTSVQRKFTDKTLAVDEYRAGVEALTKVLGAPSSVKEPTTTADDIFPSGAMFQAEWKFADLRAEVVASNFGSIRVMERMEVPWPVRVDEAK